MKEQIKAFNAKLPKSLWAFLKKDSHEKETTMRQIIVDQLERYRKKCEKRVDSK